MAIVERVNTSEVKKVVPIDVGTLQLPTEKSAVKGSLQDYVILMYGEKKIGKTTFAARFPNAIFLMFEPGGKSLALYQEQMESWTKFVKYVTLLESSAGDEYSTIIIDTVDIAYDMCFDYMCKKMAITHPTDENDYGKSWGLIEKEFKFQMNKLLNLGKGVIFISHAKEQEIKTRLQGTFTRVVPTVPTQAARYFTGTADILAYYGYYGDDRYLVIKGNDNIQAGCRLEHNFLLKEPQLEITTENVIPDEYVNFDYAGKSLPEIEQYLDWLEIHKSLMVRELKYVSAIPMGASPDESYQNTMLAFYNRQTQAYEEVRGVPTLHDPNAAIKASNKR